MGTRCAAHTLQLAVWDALRSSQIVTLIDKIRTMCRAFRSPIASEYLQVSVERVFSNLKYILSVLRGNLDSHVTDDILVMRCNNLFMRQE
ncbi:hypothetical protein ALC57_14788 [Trachymyrmex cornetzi]|uniref:Uncharacterized protein n=1 Tax=Trachymyrmex cornetzi TaxID=471704 RepID=A0A151IXR5_9HYME|nr:hypothetical protein ALC57_14788 [Trachymyrmex cornetzi]